jgi:hypothetical protein
MRHVALLGGLLLASGCLGEAKSPLVSPSPFGSRVGSAQNQVVLASLQSAPKATEETAKRVGEIGQKLVRENQQIGLRPTFQTYGHPSPAVFYVADANYQNCQIIITEGLVRQCRSDGQVAAVLASELGKLVSEREANTPAATRLGEGGPPLDVGPLGNDLGGRFGPSDGTHLAELARADRRRGRPANRPLEPPDPNKLAQAYLKQAGFSAEDLTAVQPLLRQAEEHADLEKQFKAGR